MSISLGYCAADVGNWHLIFRTAPCPCLHG